MLFPSRKLNPNQVPKVTLLYEEIGQILKTQGKDKNWFTHFQNFCLVLAQPEMFFPYPHKQMFPFSPGPVELLSCRTSYNISN